MGTEGLQLVTLALMLSLAFVLVLPAMVTAPDRVHRRTNDLNERQP